MLTRANLIAVVIGAIIGVLIGYALDKTLEIGEGEISDPRNDLKSDDLSLLRKSLIFMVIWVFLVVVFIFNLLLGIPEQIYLWFRRRASSQRTA